MDGPAAIVQTALGERPFSGDVLGFRGKRASLFKLVRWSGTNTRDDGREPR